MLLLINSNHYIEDEAVNEVSFFLPSTTHQFLLLLFWPVNHRHIYYIYGSDSVIRKQYLYTQFMAHKALQKIKSLSASVSKKKEGRKTRQHQKEDALLFL